VFITRIKIYEVTGADACKRMVGTHFCGCAPILPPDKHRVAAGQAVVGQAVGNNRIKGNDRKQQTGEQGDFFMFFEPVCPQKIRNEHHN
jgi:hypothetical protein